MTENYINHIALVLDGSVSMRGKRSTVIKVADDQIKHLARRSQELDQETRVSVYVFGDRVRCVIFDKDVLRLPSIAELYQINGNTALIDATLKSQDDLACTAQLYGDHAFLTYLLTDGEQNAGTIRDPAVLARRLNGLPENWTVACFVPDQRGVFEAKRCGFPAANIAIWDTTDQGLVEVGETMRRTTDAYMQARTTGVRGSRSLFSTGVDALNTQTVRAANLTQLHDSRFRLLDVTTDTQIRDLVEGSGFHYNVGSGYYQLMKPETIQASKSIAVQEKSTGAVYTGRNARDLLGLPAMTVRVKPEANPLFDVFVQSTSTNRKLIRGTRLLLLV